MHNPRPWPKIALVAWLAFTCASCTLMIVNATGEGGLLGRTPVWMFDLLLFTTAGLMAWLLILLAGIKIYGIAGSQGGQTPPLSGGFSPPSRPPDAGKPVPIKPSPRHHLVAAKDLPPSEKTHSLPRD